MNSLSNDENEWRVWNLIHLSESILSLISFQSFCIYVFCKVKCSLRMQTNLTIAAISLCMLMRITEDTVRFIYNLNSQKSNFEKSSIFLFVASQFGFYSILLYYNYQMTLLHNCVISPSFDLSMSSIDIKRDFAQHKRKVKYIWVALQLGLVFSYAMKCVEMYNNN